MNVPESMDPWLLRDIAWWLDIYEAALDKDLPRMLRENGVAPESDLWELCETCPGSEMQDDLRWWADEIEAQSVPTVGDTETAV